MNLQYITRNSMRYSQLFTMFIYMITDRPSVNYSGPCLSGHTTEATLSNVATNFCRS